MEWQMLVVGISGAGISEAVSKVFFWFYRLFLFRLSYLCGCVGSPLFPSFLFPFF